MADFYSRELDDAVRQLLPPEIFANISIVDAAPSATCRSHAVVEELAAHLVGILGLAGMKSQHQFPLVRATSYNHQDSGMAHHAPGFRKNITIFYSGVRQRVRRFTPTAPCEGANAPLARRHGTTGTGVFLPRAEVYQMTKASKYPKNGAKPPRLLRKEADHAMMMKQRQQHAMAATLEQQKATAAAFQGYPELLTLPQEWTY